MNRLTYKEKWFDEFGNEHQYKTRDYCHIDKLGRLEDLNEELGCPWEVVFKKIKELELQYPFSLISICKWNGKWSILEIEQIREDDFACYVKCYLKDYGKTWWLKGEKNNE